MRRIQGFSLIELAIGLVIVTLMLSALVIPLATQMDQRRSAETQRLLFEAREALLAFAIGNGRLPCPASDTSKGQESFDAGTPGNATNGVCSNSRGFLPAVTLGLSPVDSEGYQTDAFGNQYNRIRYAVWNGDVDGTTGAAPKAWYYTKIDGMKTWGAANMLQPLNPPTQAHKGFYICSKKSDVDDGCVSAQPNPPMVTLANSNAVAVIWSVGKNGAEKDRTLAAGTLQADEGANLEPAADSLVFVDRPYSSQPTDEFDDILLWISPGMLVGRLTAAGKPVN